MTAEDAINIAHEHAIAMGWPWLGPVECKRRRRCFGGFVYVIRTNATKRGANVVAIVNEADGSLKRAHVLRR